MACSRCQICGRIVKIAHQLLKVAADFINYRGLTCFITFLVTIQDSSAPKAPHKPVGVGGEVAGPGPATSPPTPTQASRRRRREDLNSYPSECQSIASGESGVGIQNKELTSEERMPMRIVAIVVSLIVIIGTLQDGFETVILPRKVSRRFRLSNMFYFSTWIAWSAIGRKMR